MGRGLSAWALVSRARYGLVWGGINAAIYLGLMSVFGSLPIQRSLMQTIPVFLISGLAQSWIWYPRAKQRLNRQKS